jgi:ABC-type multidrug transport system ATPase subunit
MEPSAVIRLDSLSKTYRSKSGGPIQAVRSVSLSVPEGQVFGFLGPNGAEKTTTIKMACGLVRPTAGQVYVNSYDVWHRRSAAMRQIGTVLEGTRNVHWPLSAWDNLIYFGNLKGVWGRHLGARADGIGARTWYARFPAACSKRWLSPAPSSPTRLSSCWTSPRWGSTCTRRVP